MTTHENRVCWCPKQARATRQAGRQARGSTRAEPHLQHAAACRLQIRHLLAQRQGQLLRLYFCTGWVGITQLEGSCCTDCGDTVASRQLCLLACTSAGADPACSQCMGEVESGDKCCGAVLASRRAHLLAAGHIRAREAPLQDGHRACRVEQRSGTCEQVGSDKRLGWQAKARHIWCHTFWPICCQATKRHASSTAHRACIKLTHPPASRPSTGMAGQARCKLQRACTPPET